MRGDLKMEIDYVEVGDYYIPALTVPDKRYNIGKYGMLRRTFLQEHHNAIYSVMMMNGTLLQHLEDVNKLCCDELDRLIPSMAKNEGITEALKSDDQMEWVRRMNSIKNRAEEFILKNYVYGGFENEEI